MSCPYRCTGCSTHDRCLRRTESSHLINVLSIHRSVMRKHAGCIVASNACEGKPEVSEEAVVRQYENLLASELQT